jgi:hypothetical protein
MRCPKCGEQSATTDYCDQCGAALDAAGGAGTGAAPAGTPSAGTPSAGAPSAGTPAAGTPSTGPTPRSSSPASGTPAGSPATSADERCPQCDAPRAALELFCEHCGYDFVSGTMPAPSPSARTSASSGLVTGGASSSTSSGSASGAVDPSTADPAPGPQGERLAWELEVGVDPARWQANASLRGDEPMPTGTTLIPLVTATALIGRRSDSRSIKPDVDTAALTNDPAVSHRHAQLTRQDDGHWVLADLGSANGTTVGGVDIVGAPRSLAAGDVIEVGAWTVVTVRAR